MVLKKVVFHKKCVWPRKFWKKSKNLKKMTKIIKNYTFLGVFRPKNCQKSSHFLGYFWIILAIIWKSYDGLPPIWCTTILKILSFCVFSIFPIYSCGFSQNNNAILFVFYDWLTHFVTIFLDNFSNVLKILRRTFTDCFVKTVHFLGNLVVYGQKWAEMGKFNERQKLVYQWISCWH